MILSVASSQSVCERREGCVTLAHRAVFDCGGLVTLCGMNLTTLRKTTNLSSVCSVHVFQLHSRLHHFSTVCVFFNLYFFLGRNWSISYLKSYKIIIQNLTASRTLADEECIQEKKNRRVLVYIPLKRSGQHIPHLIKCIQMRIQTGPPTEAHHAGTDEVSSHCEAPSPPVSLCFYCGHHVIRRSRHLKHCAAAPARWRRDKTRATLDCSV